MTVEEYNAYCSSLPATSYVIQWGGAHVWKVGGKVFAIGRWDTGQPAISCAAITFKVTRIGFEVLKDQPGLRPAPYLASRGLTWIQHFAQPGLNDEELEQHLAQSHSLIAQGLSLKKRRELELVR
jgi:predicted DNA-binding protein (MmcQ/YjbR family)